ncbi:zinc finger protein [Macleaya cordata]|uniref:Zinc finger protein n=1 Tax=Macleaya cordata TaxID=56857 RepID=A0A200R6F0_MACCD|nr:zinc finger protein [Macleaya cordata]
MKSSKTEEESTSLKRMRGMAKCLMLLKAAHHGEDLKKTITTTTNTAGTNHDDELMIMMKEDSLSSSPRSSRIFECQTCKRQFPSFQALGGHRASHKKPRLMIGGGGGGGEDSKLDETQIMKNLDFSMKSSITHECTICGQEFTIGQALGGHMRRHRNAKREGLILPAAMISPTSSTHHPLPPPPLMDPEEEDQGPPVVVVLKNKKKQSDDDDHHHENKRFSCWDLNLSPPPSESTITDDDDEVQFDDHHQFHHNDQMIMSTHESMFSKSILDSMLTNFLPDHHQ